MSRTSPYDLTAFDYSGVDVSTYDFGSDDYEIKSMLFPTPKSNRWRVSAPLRISHSEALARKRAIDGGNGVRAVGEKRGDR